MTVYVCSNPKCRAVYDSDPRGHCPTCDRTHMVGIEPNAVGFSTSAREILNPDAVRAATGALQ